MKKNTILWLLQTNQVTPTIAEFLRLFRTRMEAMGDITFMIPSRDKETLKMAKALQPVPFSISARGQERSYRGYLRKKALLQGGEYALGLPFHEALLLDDLGGGSIQEPWLNFPHQERVKGVILQIPTPLGSSNMEEKTTHAWILWAKQKKIPVMGYELLPLDTRWTLIPSMVDGIITTREESYDHLRKTLENKKQVRLLPSFEGAIFSPASTKFTLNGARAAYHFQNTLAIPQGRTVLFLPHNVAMIHEYKKLLQALRKLGKNLHLMFSIGRDQVRGTHDHQTIIETVCRQELHHFGSHSFHDINAPWEMAMADGVVSCSSCFNTCTAQAQGIPVIIMDETTPPFSRGHIRKVANPNALLNAVKSLMVQNSKRTELGAILSHVLKNQEAP